MNELPENYNQDSAPRAESPLFHIGAANVLQGQLNGADVKVTEQPLLGFLVLRGNAADTAFASGVEQAIGLALPDKLQSTVNGERRLCWISPDEWVLILPIGECFAVERALRDTLTGHFAVVNVSGGQTLLIAEGAGAVRMLKKSTPYDVHASNFPVGKVVTSVFAKTQAVFIRADENQWQLIIRRSFADYAWRWIERAIRVD